MAGCPKANWKIFPVIDRISPLRSTTAVESRAILARYLLKQTSLLMSRHVPTLVLSPGAKCCVPRGLALRLAGCLRRMLPRLCATLSISADVSCWAMGGTYTTPNSTIVRKHLVYIYSRTVKAFIHLGHRLKQFVEFVMCAWIIPE